MVRILQRFILNNKKTPTGVRAVSHLGDFVVCFSISIFLPRSVVRYLFVPFQLMGRISLHLPYCTLHFAVLPWCKQCASSVCKSSRYGSIWATLGLPKKFTPWSFESFSHFFLDFSKKKAKIFEI